MKLSTVLLIFGTFQCRSRAHLVVQCFRCFSPFEWLSRTDHGRIIGLIPYFGENDSLLGAFVLGARCWIYASFLVFPVS